MPPRFGGVAAQISDDFADSVGPDPPESAAAELHDTGLAWVSAFIPPSGKTGPGFAAVSPPITGDFGGFSANDGAFWRSPAPIGASPVITWISAPTKVYI